MPARPSDAIGSTGDPALIVRDHAAIVDAVLAKDVDAAREAVRAHYVGIEERIRRELDHVTDGT